MLHIAADGWTSPNVIAFIGTTVHWIVDGKIVSIILDFIKLGFILSSLSVSNYICEGQQRLTQVPTSLSALRNV